MDNDFDADWAALRRLSAPDAVVEARTAAVETRPLEPRPSSKQTPFRTRLRTTLARELQVGEVHHRSHTHVVKRVSLGEILEEMRLDDIDSIPPI